MCAPHSALNAYAACPDYCYEKGALLYLSPVLRNPILSSLSFSWTVLYLLDLVQGFPSWLNSHSPPLMFALREAIEPLSGLCFLCQENQAEVGAKECFFDLPLDHFKSSK